MPNVTYLLLFWLRPHDSRCVIFYNLRNYMVSIYNSARSDFRKCVSGTLKVFQLKTSVNRQNLPIKMSPKFTKFMNKTTQFVAEFNNPALGTIECTTAKTICSQEKRIKAIFSKILNWIVYTFSNLVFPSGPPSTVSIIIFFSSCLQIMLNAWHFCAYVCSTWIGDCIIRLIFAFLQSSYHQWWRVSASVYEPQQNLDQATWRRSVVVITTAQLHSTKPELRFCAGSNSARCVSDICDDEDLWQWSRVEIRLTAVRW